MYCKRCGMRRNESGPCTLCRDESPPVKNQVATRAEIDITRIPFHIIIQKTFRSNPLLCIISFIPAMIIYGFKKLSKSPWWVTYFNHIKNRYDKPAVESAEKKKDKEIAPWISSLENLGFVHVTDLENLADPLRNFSSYFRHPQENIIAQITCHCLVKKSNPLSFISYFPDKRLVILTNDLMNTPVSLPKNILYENHPDQAPEILYSRMKELIKEYGKAPAALHDAQIFILEQKFMDILLACGKEQGIIRFVENREKDVKEHPPATGHPEIPGNTSSEDSLNTGTPPPLSKKDTQSTMLACYNHSTTPAVRICNDCGTPLCEACYAEMEERFYCEKCRPEGEGFNPRSILPMFGKRIGFAGMGIRGIAFLLDLVVFSVIVLGAAKGSREVTSMLPGKPYAGMLSLFITQIFGIFFFIWYFTWPVSRHGRTLFMRILGIRVVNSRGYPPDKTATFIRFGYLVLTLLFVFPVIGYFAGMFRKNRQGFHDRLSETYAITKFPGIKAFFAWPVIIGIIFVLSAYSYSVISGFFFLSHGAKKIRFTPEWEMKLNYFSADPSQEVTVFQLVRENLVVISRGTNLVGIDGATGKRLWTIPGLSDVRIYHYSADPDLPFVFLSGNSTQVNLIRISQETGEIIFNVSVPFPSGKQKSGDSACHSYRLMYDEKTICVFDDAKRVLGFDLSGNPLFTSTLSGEFGISNIFMMEDLVVSRSISFPLAEEEGENGYSDEHTEYALSVLDRLTGEIVSDTGKVNFYPLQQVGMNHLLISSLVTRKTGLYSIPEQKVLWELNGEMPVHSNMIPKFPRTLCLTDRIVKPETGETLISFPEGYQAVWAGDERILAASLVDTWDPQNPVLERDYMIIDKNTGKVRKSFRVSANCAPYMEEETEKGVFFYCVCTKKKESEGLMKIIEMPLAKLPFFLPGLESSMELWQYDKKEEKMSAVQVGKNIPLSARKLYPDKGIFFFNSQDKIGGYKIPTKENWRLLKE